jgi:glycerophosphoryl diester phosphodiesterase
LSEKSRATSDSTNWARESGHELVAPALIAHAGGAVAGCNGTNALEALDNSYRRGHRYIEMDFCETSDGHLVALHDWENTLQTLFATSPAVLTLAQFKSLNMKHGLTQMTITDVLAWFAAHPDAYLVTDVKSDDNIQALRAISRDANGRIHRIIPQIYHPEEYRDARCIGFDQIILTLYRSSLKDDEVVSFVKDDSVLAVAMPKERAHSGSLPERLSNEGVFLYAHTVNERAEQERLGANCVSGIYSDSLAPESLNDISNGPEKPVVP